MRKYLNTAVKSLHDAYKLKSSMNKIGEIIKLSRESKSISIEEVSEILFISKDVLSSIEEGKL